MSEILTTILASTLEKAQSQISSRNEWPDSVSGLAYRMFTQTGNVKPDFMAEVPAPVIAHYFRRTPNLAAYGYVIDLCDTETRVAWIEGVEHLRGREIYPADRQSFILNPIEILGVSGGIASLIPDTENSKWFSETIIRGFKSGYFRTPLTIMAAKAALKAVDATKIVDAQIDFASLENADLFLALGIGLAFISESEELLELKEKLVKTILLKPVVINDLVEATAISITIQKYLDNFLLGSSQTSPTERIVSLCRRFPYFVDCLQKRQRGRTAFQINDEYDVQDLLHSILKLHFDDVRPEEVTPSYAGSSSRVDFYLPEESIIVEAKMTRKNLKQKEVIDELIIDTARYSQIDHVNTLICLIYDPGHYCNNPKAVEKDVEKSNSRLKVKVVVSPHGL